MRLAETAFQKILLEIKPEIPFTLGITDADGQVVSCTEPARIGTRMPEAIAFFGSGRDAGTFAEYTFRKLDCGGINHAIFAGHTGAAASIACGMAAITIEKNKLFFSERNQRTAFVKKVLLENVLPEWAHARAREMRIRSDVPRAVFLVRTSDRQDATVIELLQRMFPNEARDFVVTISETEVALVKELQQAEGDEAARIARQIDSAVAEELGLRHTVGVSTVAERFPEIACALQEAQTAASICRIFSNELTVAHFESLGIGRLIYQLPAGQCEMFLSEVFRGDAANVLDPETLFTVQVFFENNLNISEAARRLFIHRNTLVYRLEKIKKLTGLDLRKFDHAIVFQIALMVKKQLEVSQERS